MPRPMLLRLAVAMLLTSPALASAMQQDWPTYRADPGRTGAADAELATDLHPAWSRQLSAPSPAWPNPARGSYWQNLSHIEPRVIDDRADHPVAAGGRVYLGSSRDDTVRSFDLESGQESWAFTTGGPVRFAPLVHGETVYFGSDDGFVYALDAQTGEQRWSRRIGPEGNRIAGNGRLISPWPVRTGLVSDGERLYVTAGLFPSQGVYAACLKLADGEPVWQRQLDASPQGYLLLANDLVIVPTGRATPITLRQSDGEAGPNLPGVGGTFAVVAGDRVISGRGNDDTLTGAPLAPGDKVVQFPGKHMAVTAERSYLLGRGKLAAIDRTAGADDPQAGILWTVDCESDDSLAVVGDQVLVGGEDVVLRFDAQTGEPLAALAVEGRAMGMAASDGRLLITTDTGGLCCFSATAAAGGRWVGSGSGGVSPFADVGLATQLVEPLDVPRGFALLVGSEDHVELAEALVAVSDLHVCLLVDDQVSAQLARASHNRDGDLAGRLSVVVSEGDRLPFADYLFNLVIADKDGAIPESEFTRVCVPGRGLLVLDGWATHRRSLPDAGAWTHQFADLGNSANAGDPYTTADLALQWFGGPGPERMIDRHMRGPAPLAVGGRLFIIAENHLIAIDSYNGTELWDIALPDSQRYAMPYDAGYIAARPDAVFAAVDDELWQIDAATGEVAERLRLPAGVRDGHHIGYVGVDGDELILSATLPTAHYTEPGRTLADVSYRSVQPLTTAQAIVSMDAATGRSNWQHTGGAIVHPTITVTPDTVCFVEARNRASREHATGMIDLPTLLGSDAWLVALDRSTGELAWELPLEIPQAKNILYLQHADGRLYLTACQDSGDSDAYYHIRVLEAAGGEEIWRTEHGNLKPGQLYHGEQVHHPVVLGDLFVAEPFIYRAATGELVNPDGEGEWSLKRPGHSCGTLSGSGDCLFFRAGNPTVLDLRPGVDPRERFTKISPSRVGCWINILPADGMVLIPEASASCVCHYSLQTSMGFRPIPTGR